MKRNKHWGFLVVSLVLLVLVIPLSVMIGARNVPFADMLGAVQGKEVDAIVSAIIQKRILRTVLGLLAGCALGTAGCLMQSITRNPIADPAILGVNTGASLFVVSGIAFFNIHAYKAEEDYAVNAIELQKSENYVIYGIPVYIKELSAPKSVYLVCTCRSSDYFLSGVWSGILFSGKRNGIFEEFRPDPSGTFRCGDQYSMFFPDQYGHASTNKCYAGVPFLADR